MRSLSAIRWSTKSLVALCALLGGLGWIAGRGLSEWSVTSSNALPHRHANAETARDEITASGTTEAAAPFVAAFAEHWSHLHAQASTPSRDRALAALLEQLARTDPERALALASEEHNWRLSDELRDASLRGWAFADPAAAGQCALTVRTEDRRRAVAAVLQGAAAASPDAAVQTSLELCRADPGPAGDYGHATVAALVQNGAFAEAVRFGESLGADKFPFILKSAYYEWALRQPDAALASLDSIRDPVTRSRAASQVYFGWARSDAAGLAAHALSLPPGEARTQALAEALPIWVEKDPVAATAWINDNDTGGDFDDGASAVANLQTLVTRQPAKAMEWAGSINDPHKREQTLRSVFRQWAEKDPAAARRFLESAASSQDRNILVSELRDLSSGS